MGSLIWRLIHKRSGRDAPQILRPIHSEAWDTDQPLSRKLKKGCTESIQPFWISREPVGWPWCNLATSQRRPYWASVNSRSPVGLVSQQWDAVDRACVLCDSRIHNDRASRSASSRQYACPFYSSRAGFFSKASHHPGLSAPPTAQIWLPLTYGFSQS